MPALYHIGITVESLDESVAFYRDVVGLHEIRESSNLELSGEWFDTLTENQGAALRVAHLDLAGTQLQLVEYTAGGGERLPLAHKQVGNPHLCFDMEDITARHAALVAEVQVHARPVEPRREGGVDRRGRRAAAEGDVGGAALGDGALDQRLEPGNGARSDVLVHEDARHEIGTHWWPARDRSSVASRGPWAPRS